MSFTDWKKRSDRFCTLIARDRYNAPDIEEVARAAYKAGERAGLKAGEDIAKRAIELRELMRSNV